jgi:RNA polymerase sigma-70 factor (ECF subfamily)
VPGILFRAPELAVGDPYADLSDSELAARFDRGEGEALNALCRRHYSAVFRLAYTLTQNTPEAEDCTQETFARFIRSWSRWSERDRGAGPWLTAIVRNVVMDHWQTQLKVAKANHPLALMGSGEATASQSPDVEALERELMEAIEQSLQTMEPPCRELLELLFRKGMTQKQAAEAVGDSHEAVKKRYQRCLKRLQADLKEWGVS